MSQAFTTPALRNLRNLVDLSSYGVKYHTLFSGVKDGVREVIHITHPIDWSVVALSHDCYMVQRCAVGEDTHITYYQNGGVISIGSSDARDEIEADGYTDVYLVKDYILLMLSEHDARRGIKKGLLEAGA